MDPRTLCSNEDEISHSIEDMHHVGRCLNGLVTHRASRGHRGHCGKTSITRLYGRGLLDYLDKHLEA